MTARKMRHLVLVLVLGDRLGSRSVAFEGFNPSCDRILMAEFVEESEHVPSTKMRTALFRSAMRHFAEERAAHAWPFDYLRPGALSARRARDGGSRHLLHRTRSPARCWWMSRRNSAITPAVPMLSTGR